MDNSATNALQRSVGKFFETKTQKQRNQKQRSVENINGHHIASNNNHNNTKRTQTAATKDKDQENYSESKDNGKAEGNEEAKQNVMGGGFATPPLSALQTATTATATITTTTAENKKPNITTTNKVSQAIIGATTSTTATASGSGSITKTTKPSTITSFAETTAAATPTATATPQMHEKITDKHDNCKEKTEKQKPQKKDTEKPIKFAEKLRRSFRRGEHKSLEIKRTEKVDASPTTDNLLLSPKNKKQTGLRKNSKSIISLSNLPGLAGHINPALLLDSPEERTPPEFAYQHLSSVATTNSSTSLESSFDFGERTSSLSSINHWPWQQSNSSMGGEISTASNSAGTSTRTGAQAAAEGRERKNKENEKREKEKMTNKRLEPQHSSKSDTQQSHANASRSCSVSSESSSAKLTRLQNFLFKSSNESTRSYLGHSNEGFTASSHNSSSGEWENLGSTAASSSGGTGYGTVHDFHVGSFPEQHEYEILTESTNAGTTTTASIKPASGAEGGSFSTRDTTDSGNYYQYTLTSPNNPFLPEIIARTYHSAYEEAEEDQFRQQEEELDANVTSVKYRISGGESGSAQLPTPTYSRAGSQESTHSEGGGSSCGSGSGAARSAPGRHKRKLFSLNSPTRHFLHHQEPQQHQRPHLTTTAGTSSTMTSLSTAAEAIKFTASASGNFVRSLNPFLPAASTPSEQTKSQTSPKHSAATSPIAVPQDLNAKREEFLRATMKICLVVSPPSSKLQLKSKSLTHLDGLDSMIACHHGAVTAGKPSIKNCGLTGDKAAGSSQYTLNPALIGGNTGSTTICTGSGSGTGAGDIFSTGTGVASHKKKSSFMQRKKPLLTRSEVSSSEYFSVSFCTDNGYQDEEFIPAMKGVTLATALNQVLRRRNLTFSQIIISDHHNPTPSFLDAGYSPVASSLDENTEVENLAGRHLIITERDGSRKTLQKAASFGSRSRPPRLLSSASTEETSESAAPSKQIKQRWSGLFGIKNPQQSQLCELLNHYAKSGVPQRKATLTFDHPDLDAALGYLDNMHKTWKDFVDSEGMSENEMRVQTAIWELVTTEVLYIHALQTVTDLFLACLEAVQDVFILMDVDQHRLFSNVRDICEANLKFWTLYLYPMVAHSMTTREPLRIGFFQQGFVAFASIFAPYKKYCAEQSTCQFYCKELNRNNALFTSYLAWCESHKMCNRLRLADILVRPMQRLTKYSLLLAAIKKHMSDVEEIEAVDTMIHTVENFVCSVNNHLTTRQEYERLKGVMARIESYDAVDTNNEHLEKMIKQYSQMFDLCAPMKGCHAQHVRHLFMEGDHKFKDNLGKADVHCFLLTDILLVCKSIAKKGLGSLKVIRQPYLTDRLVVQLINNILHCVYLNDFQVAITAFTLQCSEAKNWYESLKRARMIYTRLKQGSNNWDSFRFGGSVASAGTADSLGVKKSPMNSSICSHVSSANNSHSGSVEWNDSRNISVDFEKTNSLSSDEGSSLMGAHGLPLKSKNLLASPHKHKTITSSANTLSVQPLNHLGQSLPNLNLHLSHTNLYHTYSNNTLLVPGTTTSHSGVLLLSPSHRGISYPPPSPARVPLRRGMAFSTSTKNPPLVKTRNITSQNSINWHQIPATPIPTPTPLSPQQTQYNTILNNITASAIATTTTTITTAAGTVGTVTSVTNTINTSNNSVGISPTLQQHQQQQQQPPLLISENIDCMDTASVAAVASVASVVSADLLTKGVNQNLSSGNLNCHPPLQSQQSSNNETDV